MELKIEQQKVGRQTGPKWEDYYKVPGYRISISFNNMADWQIIGINDGLSLEETIQLRDALNELGLGGQPK